MKDKVKEYHKNKSDIKNIHLSQILQEIQCTNVLLYKIFLFVTTKSCSSIDMQTLEIFLCPCISKENVREEKEQSIFLREKVCF